MADAVYNGAINLDNIEINVRLRRANDAGVYDLLQADGLILGTPENFGYMSGQLKDFFDRVYYPCEGCCEGLPYTLFVAAGNDGTGAVRAVQRISKGLALNMIQPPLICNTAITDDVIRQCHTLGATFAAGLEMGIF